MSEVVVIAYVPVLHEGYRRFLTTHADGKRMFLIGPGLYSNYHPLAKDIRGLDVTLVAKAIASWAICDSVSVLYGPADAQQLAIEDLTLILPAEDVSYQVVDMFFPRHPIFYDSVFLRWDKTRTVQLGTPSPTEHDTLPSRMLMEIAEQAASGSADWWRQVGAVLMFSNGEVATARNEHLPHESSPYVVGDPRSNFSQGIHLELSTSAHAELRVIAEAARVGRSTADATIYVTDFPCPACAKLVAAAGITRLFYKKGYAVLDGQDVLERSGVKIVEVV